MICESTLYIHLHAIHAVDDAPLSGITRASFANPRYAPAPVMFDLHSYVPPQL
jgi:hypothetical protein